MRRRAIDAESKIARALLKKPGAWAMLALIRASKPYQATHDGDEAKRARAMRSPVLLGLLGHIPNPSWDGVMKITSECGVMFALFDPHLDGRSGFVDLVSESLGITLEPPPSYESFLPREFRAKSM